MESPKNVESNNIINDNDDRARQISIEILRVDANQNSKSIMKLCEDGQEFIESVGSIEDTEEDTNVQMLVSEGVQSNRTSLIITHEDGTTEENECEVTCLGLTPDTGHRRSVEIQELFQIKMTIQETENVDDKEVI